MNKKITKTFSFNGQEIIFETGHIGFRADSALTIRQGETVLMIFVTASDKPSELDYFPLGITYFEKDYAAGIISGSRYIKRERRPSDENIVKGREIDRALRPLFPEGFKNEVNVVINVMAYDGINDPVDLGITGASLALMLSSVPFEGPVSGITIGMDEKGELKVNPSLEELKTSSLDASFGVNEVGITMLEVGANIVKEEEMSKAFELAYKEGQKLIGWQKEIAKELGKEKMQFEPFKPGKVLVKKIEEKYAKEIEYALFNDDDRRSMLREIEAKAVEEIRTEKGFEEESPFLIVEAVNKVAKKITRHSMLKEKKRLSNRAMDEVRVLDVEAGVLPRVHGSALFSRGITQVMSVATLGSVRLVQTLEGLEGEESKRYIHHYNGPRYSLGEAGRFEFYPGNREIGHGAMAEKALLPVIPPMDEFPYAIRVVSEILSQSGSSSQAATCGSSLALMDAGVPIKAPVGGIAIGLVTGETQDEFQLVTDMQDVEDFYGDMDFKVMGTMEGITAIQMDNKLNGVKVEILQKALIEAKKGREVVLEAMIKIIAEPRNNLSKYAPKVEIVKINPAKIGELIGPGGKNIKKMAEILGDGVDINIEDTGDVFVTTSDTELMAKAVQMIKAVVEEAEVGKVYEGTIDRIENYGAFVDVSPAISGLIHVSEMADGFVKDPNAIVKLGQKVRAKVIRIDEQGKVSMTLKGIDQVSKAESDRA
ncbi:polyribonucleotide nucleotidyltransferase [Candidatus Dojkabacteria bacterium]|nr:polyribonucleotide nucleotidyltransferase [Candidatus Dojkabacteria bacterium]